MQFFQLKKDCDAQGIKVLCDQDRGIYTLQNGAYSLRDSFMLLNVIPIIPPAFRATLEILGDGNFPYVKVYFGHDEVCRHIEKSPNSPFWVALPKGLPTIIVNKKVQFEIRPIYDPVWDFGNPEVVDSYMEPRPSGSIDPFDLKP